MKIKLDGNLPSSLAVSLGNLGHDVHTTHGEGLAGRPDHEVWRAAQRESRFLITQDLDYSDVRQFSPGAHHGILLVRLHLPDPRDLVDRVNEIFHAEDVAEWPGCFVVATERKIRLLKPPNKQNL
jgi:predicted nuclease of predicted toxin-antitoxin system